MAWFLATAFGAVTFAVAILIATHHANVTVTIFYAPILALTTTFKELATIFIAGGLNFACGMRPPDADNSSPGCVSEKPKGSRGQRQRARILAFEPPPMSDQRNRYAR